MVSQTIILLVDQSMLFVKYSCSFSLRHLSDINKDNALNLDEFCIAMHLVVALRHGLELPSTLPAVLLPEKETGGNISTVQGMHSDSSDISPTKLEKCKTV